ncbi:PTS transporter subunit EIIC [Spiroplasma tabanidicola]|uniref:PTS system, sucrose-specific IIB component n=1 Tax=Spiroplasma tabanidicola TaxID=324079 RepID=A0A6I6CC56_9MOLU|nr:PTS transporter subunit EIIC [Spiroplasma tabanidicola]QGS51838.1 PTS system, sucrose-specific IIB component [Spiroplasma tabanidicola]
MKKINWDEYATEVIKNVGGKENIKEIFNCATRCRFYLNDDSKINVANLKQIEIVKGYNLAETEHQLIIGAGVVDKLVRAINNQLNKNGESGNFESKPKVKLWNKKLSFKQNTLQITKRGMNSFAAIFVPLVPVFIAGGMSLALVSLVNQISKNTGFAKILDIIGGGILGSLPAFVGYTAAKKWGGNPYLGMAMGLVLIAPALMNSYANNKPVMIGADINASSEWIEASVNEAFEKWKTEQLAAGISAESLSQLSANEVVGVYQTIFSGFFKIKLIGYQAQIVPILLVLALSVNLEKLMRKYIPDIVGIIIVPLGVVIISSWLAFWAIGPLGQIIGKGIAIALTAIFKYTNYTGIGFGGMLFAGLYPLIVITGLHQGFLPIETQLLMDTNLTYGHSFSFITPVACVSNIAQGSAVLVAAILIKDKKEKSKAISGAFGANLGITEPAMFGINLQIKPLLVGAMIGSAVGGYWLGMTHTVANSLGSASWVGLVQFDWSAQYAQNYFEANKIHAAFTSWPPGANVVIAMVLSMGVSFTSAFFLMKTRWGLRSLKAYLDSMNIKNDIKVLEKKVKAEKPKKVKAQN